MKNEDVYNHWRQGRRHVATSPEFGSTVMERIARQAESERRLAPALVERVGARPWARAAMIAMAALLGIGRILLTLRVLFFA
jgi:hypothetical protein